MCARNTLLILLLLLFSFSASADTFIVSSNADSGPGTLREALTLAAINDSTQTDYINFNLADLSEAGRTIRLTSQLPDLSSNLVIDGSTQPGVNFGRSDARVMLSFQIVPNMGFVGLQAANKHDIAVYGLYVNLLTDLSRAGYSYWYSAIDFTNCKNIKVGAAGKGNVFNGFPVPFSTNLRTVGSVPFENLTIQDNFFGVSADGETMGVNAGGPISVHFVTGNVIIGGAAGEGNLCPYGIGILQRNYDNPNIPDVPLGNFTIKNNIIGTDINQQQAIAHIVGLSIEAQTTGAKNAFRIEDNVITAQNGVGIDMLGMTKPSYILRNYINTDKRLQVKLGGIQTGIKINTCEQVFVGSANPADANYITQCKPISVATNSTVSINKNSFYCADTTTPIYFENLQLRPIPEVDILNATANFITGTATPGAVVELFYSDACGTCSPQSYFASVTAGADGKWQFGGLMSGEVIASATLNNSTSEFTRARINIDKIKVIDACGDRGAITGAIIRNAKSIKWLNEAGDVVGTEADLVNVPAGRYKLVVDNGICTDETPYYPILNAGVGLNATNVQIKKASCGQPDGAITGITSNVTGAEVFKWTNEAGAIVGNKIDLINVPPGNYTLNISAAGNSCPENYGPVLIGSNGGPAIDQSNALIQATNCGQTQGSIKGITATGSGTLKYSWRDQDQKEVSTTADLVNQPAGTYTLQVTDASQCGPVYSSGMMISELNGVTLDDANVHISASSCNMANGAVKDIRVTGATVYQWTNAAQQIVGSGNDLLNVPEGDYTLTASNNFGCSQAKNYHVGSSSSTQYPVYVNIVTNSCFAQASGSINVTADALVKAARWADANGSTVGSGLTINNLAAGVYQLYLTDANGCESFYNKYEVREIPLLEIVSGSQQIINDDCNLKTGSIKNIQITGGVPPYSYSWTDANEKLVSSSADVAGLNEGAYTLHVYDGANCQQVSATYNVQNQDKVVITPSVNDVQACSAGNVLLKINNPTVNYHFRVYDTQTSTAPLLENASGIFNLPVNQNRSYYVSQLSGDCESARVTVKVSVGLSIKNIPNTFTPNGDGINDYWYIPGIENSPAASVKIFNRYGNKVFESVGYARPFDGKSSGKDLPVGSYYYIIDMGSACSVLSGTLVIVR